LLADPKAVELHQLGLVEFYRDPRPEGVEVIGPPARRHGNWHDRIHRQVEGTSGGRHGGADRPGLRATRRGEIIGRRPLCRGAQFIYMCQCQKNGWGPPCKLRVGPSAKIIKTFAVRPAGRRGRDPTSKINCRIVWRSCRGLDAADLVQALPHDRTVALLSGMSADRAADCSVTSRNRPVLSFWAVSTAKHKHRFSGFLHIRNIARGLAEYLNGPL
jgi:hypothetical protein